MTATTVIEKQESLRVGIGHPVAAVDTGEIGNEACGRAPLRRPQGSERLRGRVAADGGPVRRRDRRAGPSRGRRAAVVA